jgi:hypothetical protein
MLKSLHKPATRAQGSWIDLDPIFAQHADVFISFALPFFRRGLMVREAPLGLQI